MILFNTFEIHTFLRDNVPDFASFFSSGYTVKKKKRKKRRWKVIKHAPHILLRTLNTILEKFQQRRNLQTWLKGVSA